MRILILSAFVLPFLANAQSVSVKDVETNQDGTTTIEIRKGAKQETPIATGAKKQIVEGTKELEGEGTMMTEAKKDWKANCKQWEKDFRKEQKDNGDTVLSTDCEGKVKVACSGEVGKKVCTSTGTYKIKTSLE